VAEVLTVGQVFARIRADVAQRSLPLARSDLAATQAHAGADTPLPEELSLRRVSQLLADLGVQVSRRFQELFRSTAILMRMGQDETMPGMREPGTGDARSRPPRYANSPMFLFSPSVAERRGAYFVARDAPPEGTVMPPAPAQPPAEDAGEVKGEQEAKGEQEIEEYRVNDAGGADGNDEARAGEP
jgi:hypothetical protein